ncbi:MAG: WD40/YVTN/BNR-like repeat-containing protein [Ignavibacteria bacterium]
MKRIIYIIVLLIAHCTLTIEDCEGQWYQVNLPIASPIQRVQFVNQNTGWLILYNLNLLKTTNSGINWAVVTDSSKRIFDFQFINDTLGYGMATNTSGANLLLKTTNSGYNWITMQSSSNYALGGFYFVNADTGWVNAFSLAAQTTFMTTDGFQTLNPIATGPGGNPATIYFFKEPYNGSLCGYMSGGGNLWKTTNSGFNWTLLSFSEAGVIRGFSFINKDTGWVVYDPNIDNNKIERTVNGGLNWDLQYYDASNYGLVNIFAIKANKIWCGTGMNFIFIITNNGQNWGHQSSPIVTNYNIYFYDTLLGFAWSGTHLVRTTNGGGTIIGINQISTEVPKKFSLGQNYPNPFNPTTNIPFELKEPSHVTLKVFDARGREVKELVNGRWGTGKFIADFDVRHGVCLKTYFV